MNKPYGVDIYISRDIDLSDAKLAISEVLRLPVDNIWDGDAVAIGEMLDDGVPDSWAVFWKTGNIDFPIKFDIEAIDGRDPRLAIGDLRRALNGDIAIPDDSSENPYAMILFKENGTIEKTSMDEV
ncbi:hypothetical protein AGR1B_pa0227 [Agrobacterium fabacearum S56]|uniref:hypothetical protein n=1 Tax=Agrobacterium tumefaciens TaxID=358 RepID=UPI0009BB2EF3|nr:hypothetical protein [Agrobacterium tumefaciens]CUX06983.1 hypothetical protein AGR1B_pa0227 [Agrobacterium fabacearum S56]